MPDGGVELGVFHDFARLDCLPIFASFDSYNLYYVKLRRRQNKRLLLFWGSGVQESEVRVQGSEGSAKSETLLFAGKSYQKSTGKAGYFFV
jgi:hypothetical protein